MLWSERKHLHMKAPQSQFQRRPLLVLNELSVPVLFLFKGHRFINMNRKISQSRTVSRLYSKANHPLIIKTYPKWMLVYFPRWNEDPWRLFLVSLCSLWNMIVVWSALCVPARNYILSYIMCYCFILLSLLTLMKLLEDLVYYYLLWSPKHL